MRYHWIDTRAATLIACLCAVTSLTACTQRVHRTIGCFQNPACAVQLGMSEESFLALIEAEPAEASGAKAPTRFTSGDSAFVVHYVPVERAPHKFDSDGKYVPYTFVEGRLMAVGSAYLLNDERIVDADRADSREVETGAAETMDVAAPNTAESGTEYRRRGPFKWCAPSSYLHGGCGARPCC